MTNNNGKPTNGTNHHSSSVTERDWRMHMEDRIQDLQGEVKRLCALLDAHLHVESFKHTQDLAQQQQIDDLIKTLNQIKGGKAVAVGILAALGAFVGALAWLWDKVWPVITHAGGR